MESLLERPNEVFILLSNSQCRPQRQDLAKVLPSWLLSPPFPSSLILSCSLRTFSEQTFAARCCFSYRTHSLRWRWGGEPSSRSCLQLVTEKSLNWVIFKDINLNIGSNIICFLKVFGMFHFFLTNERMLLYRSNSDLHRISLK